MLDTDEVHSCITTGALRIGLNRPHAMNALTPTIVSKIRSLLRENIDSPFVKAVVLTGRGRAFCAGADLKLVRDQASGSANALRDFLGSVTAMMTEIESFPHPVIAAVNGIALAGGLELVLCCDLVVAARSAKIGDAHANFGLLPGGGASVRLPRKIGVTRAKYLFYTGDSVAAEELIATGLVNQVVDDDELETATDRIIAKLTNKSSLTLRRMKALIDNGLEQPQEIALRTELLAGEVHSHSFDMNEGLAAFEEKRAPQFRGR